MNLPAWATSDIFVISIMLLAGLGVALRETLIKYYGSRTQAIFNMNALGFLGFAPLMLFVPPPPPVSFFWITVGGIACGIGMSLRFWAYQQGDAGSMYPTYRAVQVIVIALFGTLFLQEYLSLQTVIALALVIISMVVVYWRPRDSLPKLDKAFAVICGAGAVIGLYICFDAIGVRLSGAPLHYIPYAIAISCVPPMLITIYRQGWQTVPEFKRSWRRDFWPALFGKLAVVADIYVLYFAAMAEMVIYSKSALIFAVVLGLIFLREKFIWRRVIGCAGIFAGIVIIALH